MPMATLSFYSLILSFLLQTGNMPVFFEDLFTEKEKNKIEKNHDDLEERIEVYRDASIRMHKNIRRDITGNNYDIVPDRLQTWLSLLLESLKDIEANINPKKRKLKDLIKYEIQIRKSINDLRDYQLRAPVKQQDVFERCIEQADSIRSKIVDILFQ